VLGLMMLGAMQPTIEFDALEYHLQGPKEYFQAGRIAFLPHNVYTSMPSAVEMLHLLGMTVLDDWWLGALAGQLLIAGFAPASAALVASTAMRWGSGRAAWFAALVYLTTPWIFRLGTFPFVEGPLCAYHAALVLVAAAAWSIPRDGPRPTALWLFAGLLAGGAMACKYPGLVSAVLPFGAVAAVDSWRRRSWRIPMAFAVGVAAGVGPWLVRNLADTGNPVYPLGFGIFGGTDWDADLDAKWWSAHGPRPTTLVALASAAVDVAGRSDWHSPLYALLVPLAILRRGTRAFAAVLGVYVLYLFATWFLMTHRLDRFWLPLLPAAAVLAGLGADWTRGRPWPSWLAAVTILATAANLVFITTPISGPTDWTADLDRLRVEAANAASPSLARLDAALPGGASPLIVGQAGVFPVDRPILYNTVFDRERIEQIVAGRSPEEIRAQLNRLGVTHVYVDWAEIARHTRPGGYGFSPVVTRRLFDDLVSARVLAPPTSMGPDHLLYRVLGPARPNPEDFRSP
jgi:4-amino-4-deoxy-L-arabinose transferase-like glycosyltransferase